MAEAVKNIAIGKDKDKQTSVNTELDKNEILKLLDKKAKEHRSQNGG